MKNTARIFAVTAILVAAVAFLSCSNGNASGGSGGETSSTTVLSGKIYTATDPEDGSTTVLSFAASGNSVTLTADGITGTGTYTMSGTTVTIVANGSTTTFVYNSTSDTLYSSDLGGLTFVRLS